MTLNCLQLEGIKSDNHSLIEIGSFLVDHRHHRVDLLGDDGDDGGLNWDDSEFRDLTFDSRWDFWISRIKDKYDVSLSDSEKILEKHLASIFESDASIKK